MQGYREGIITKKQVRGVVWKNFFHGKLTFTHWNKGEEMAPTIGPQVCTLLVRKIPNSDYLPYSIGYSIGDVVVFKDPIESENFIVRRLAAVEGYEMISTDEKDEPFVLEKDECWVVADNESIKPEEANDSRTFGPVSTSSIVGRVIYCLRNAVDHGPINNSEASVLEDTPVLEVELDVDEMVKNHKE
ncbi:hypothetical protein Leryth_017462 [Lithospermum erythrorhizon]|nr:hypothetical protein Leryth_017462 [Lithospermum erythrorhizon]